ncbi:Protein of unknown function [Pseudonocardia ammonioxydans]|uniref:Apiosidase-like catalytic domain-containing protein n=1 Tax=Pseudonocardia ammonioxydans TaxID=260086 RepID=A0A1I5H070_PSUAM|nr:DUF4038 domain-containing protein [Pseudonocardia ammonioxydans]SFO41426.1 Protein of unknown function [Pseudonocardia ammonioxydans]
MPGPEWPLWPAGRDLPDSPGFHRPAGYLSPPTTQPIHEQPHVRVSAVNGSAITESTARGYGEFLGERFGARDNVTWTLGGDHPADGEEQLWTELAEGLDDTGGTQIKTYHPRGDQSSATWFADATGWTST